MIVSRLDLRKAEEGLAHEIVPLACGLNLIFDLAHFETCLLQNYNYIYAMS